MKTYGLEKKHWDIIKNGLNSIFKSKKVPNVYLFGSRAVNKHRKNSDIDIAIQRVGGLRREILKLKDFYDDFEIPYKVDVVLWDEIVEDYLPSINKQKKLIFSSKIKDQTNQWRVCPLGEHWVRHHDKKKSSGVVGDWDGHCRKNKSGKDILNHEEIQLISESDIFLSAKPNASKNEIGYPNQNNFDSLIDGWTAYWNSIFKVKKPLHPNHVKALIASESGFHADAKASNRLKVGDARGLVQITDQTHKILKDKKGELRDHFVLLRRKDLGNPNHNLAAAIRWLFRKRETAKAKLKREPKWEEVIFEYKGILRQKGPKSDKIRKKYRSLFSKLSSKK